MRAGAAGPVVDEVLSIRIGGRRGLVHAREQRRDEEGRVRLFLTGDPQALPHLGGMRIATRAGEHFELGAVQLVPPPAEPGEEPAAARAGLALAHPVGPGRWATPGEARAAQSPAGARP